MAGFGIFSRLERNRAGPKVSPRVGLFHHGGKPDNTRIAYHRTNYLNPCRQAVAHNATEHRDSGMAGHAKGMGIGIPALSDTAGVLITDCDRLVEITIGVDRRAAKRGYQQKIDAFEPGLYSPV